MVTRFYTASKADYGDQEAAMAAYLEAGTARAMALGNRGPIRFRGCSSGHRRRSRRRIRISLRKVLLQAQKRV